jgi:hypothetical protein
MHASDRNVWAQRTVYSTFFFPYGGLAGIFLNIYNYVYRVEMHGDISSILGGLWTWPLKLHLRYKNELNWRLVLAVFLSVFWFSSVSLNSTSFLLISLNRGLMVFQVFVFKTLWKTIWKMAAENFCFYYQLYIKS